MSSPLALDHTTFLLTFSASLALTLLLPALALLPPILARRPRAPASRIALAFASTGAIAIAGIASLAAIAGGGGSARAAGGAFGLLGVLLLDSYILFVSLTPQHGHLIQAILSGLLAFSTLLHIFIFALELDHSKMAGLVATRALVHIAFDVVVAVLLLRRGIGRKEGEAEREGGEAARTAAGQQHRQAQATATGSIVYHGSQDDLAGSELGYRRFALPLLQLVSIVLFILSAALPVTHDYSTIMSDAPAPTWMGTTTSPAGYIVLALFGVIRWTGVLVDLAVYDPSSTPEDSSWDDEPSLLNAEVAEARQYHQHDHQRHRDSMFTASSSALDSFPASQLARAAAHHLRPESNAGSNTDSTVARDNYSLSPSPNPDTHRTSLSSMGRPISQVSSFFASTSPARGSMSASPFQAHSASQAHPPAPGANKKHRKRHSIPSFSFPSLSATSSNEYSSRPPRLATPPLLFHSHTSPSPVTSSAPTSPYSSPPNPLPTTTTTAGSKKRRPSLSALQLAFDSPTLSLSNLREFVSPTPKTPGSASATLNNSNAPSEAGMELEMPEGEGEDPFARGPSREAMVEHWRRRSGGDALEGGGAGEGGADKEELVSAAAAAAAGGGRVSMVVEEVHERISEEDEEQGAGGGEATGETEYHEVLHTGSGFTTAQYSTPPRPSLDNGCVEGRDRSASHTSTRSAFLEEFGRSLATDLHLQQADVGDESSHSSSDQEQDVYLDPFPAPGSPESLAAKLHRHSEETKLGLHPSSSPPLSRRPSLKPHTSAPPRATTASSSPSPTPLISPPRPTLRKPSISSPSPPTTSAFSSLRRIASRRKDRTVAQLAPPSGAGAEDGDRKSAYSDLSFACVGDQSAASSIEFEMRRKDEFGRLGLGLALGAGAAGGRGRAMEGELEEDLVGVELREVEDARDGVEEKEQGQEQEQGKGRRGPSSSQLGSLKRGAWWSRLSSRPTSFIGTPYRARSASSPVPRHSTTTTSGSLKSSFDIATSASVSGRQTPYSNAGSNALGLEFRLPTPTNLSPLSSLDFGSEDGSAEGGDGEGGLRRSSEQRGAGRPSLDLEIHSTSSSSPHSRHSHQSHLAQPSPQRATSLTSLEELTELVNSFERTKAAEEAQAQAKKDVADLIAYTSPSTRLDSPTAEPQADFSPSLTDNSSLPSPPSSRPATSLSFFSRTNGRSVSPSSTSPFFSTASLGRTHTRTISAPLSSPASWRKEYALSNYASTDTESLHLFDSPLSPAFSRMADSPSPSTSAPSASPSPSPSPSFIASSPDDLVGYGTLSSPTSFASLSLPSSSAPTSPDFALASWSRATRVRAKRGTTVGKGRERTMSEGMWSPISSVGSEWEGEAVEEEKERENEFSAGGRVDEEGETTMRGK